MYFDAAASTPPHPEVLKTYDAVNRDFWANPHALHRPGLRAESLLGQARKQVLELLGAAEGFRCVFTSGATEANNTALKGVAQRMRERGRHMITSAVEHPSVLEVCRWLQLEGAALTVLPVNAAGCVEPDDLQRSLRPDTVLVSLMQVNNEVGAINDIMRLGALVQAHPLALFHVDAAQSVGKMPLTLSGSPIDLLSFSAHKFFGLKGSGALVLRERMELPPLLHGGGQEDGVRSGTADVARAAALAKALRLAVEAQETDWTRAKAFKQQMVAAVEQIAGTRLNGSMKEASPYILNISVEGARPETILQALAEREIYISTVSACAAQKRAESHVVRAMSGCPQRAQRSLRISFSSQTTQDEVDGLCDALGPVIEAVRFKRK